ncbi:IS66 family insertion sequence element accessory protein TnpB [Sorangium sp. So ce367]|uniref:IS66 family insertion sequence element accessory protein TnpB n=1 Tax=Sorangium sp. So ce367 TaxID=3133305 RepID=UPI003F6447C2
MIPGRVSIYVATEPLDLRRSFDGLAAVVREVLRQDPLSGALFLFFNRAADRCKALWWDRSGYCLLYNHLSSYYTSFEFRRGRWFRLRDARAAAARSLRRSQRLQCFLG